MSRHPWLVAFLFGLSHGAGLAGGWQQLGLSRGETLQALALFNLGVEVGPAAVHRRGALADLAVAPAPPADAAVAAAAAAQTVILEIAGFRASHRFALTSERTDIARQLCCDGLSAGCPGQRRPPASAESAPSIEAPHHTIRAGRRRSSGTPAASPWRGQWGSLRVGQNRIKRVNGSSH